MSSLVNRASRRMAYVALLICLPAVASGEAPEYEVKAGFLYNFTKFVTWPPEAFRGPNSPIVIGILGEDPFGQGLEASLSGETAQGRAVHVRKITRVEDAAQACQVLFVSRSERGKAREILRALAGRPILTVGDDEDFAAQGGVIQFYLEQRRVRFVINMAASQRAGLKISSQLLQLARVIPE